MDEGGMELLDRVDWACLSDRPSSSSIHEPDFKGL